MNEPTQTIDTLIAALQAAKKGRTSGGNIPVYLGSVTLEARPFHSYDEVKITEYTDIMANDDGLFLVLGRADDWKERVFEREHPGFFIEAAQLSAQTAERIIDWAGVLREFQFKSGEQWFEPDAADHLMIRTAGKKADLHRGDWITQRHDGTFRAYTPDEFAAQHWQTGA